MSGISDATLLRMVLNPKALDIEAIKRRAAWVEDGATWPKPEYPDRTNPDGVTFYRSARIETDALLDRRDLIVEVDSLTAWRQISEAPKDGTEILCWCPDIGQRVLCFLSGAWWLSGTQFNDYEPTHWLPLQAGPTS